MKQLGLFNKILPNVPDGTLEKLLTYATLEVSQGVDTPSKWHNIKFNLN